jgi:Helix-turn-helix domain
MKQTIRILNHLIDHGYITQIIASNYGIRRCASRVSELKQDGGFPIQTIMKKDDAGVRYAYYRIDTATRKFLRTARRRNPQIFQQ